nr:MAG TPA: hypothetical protein [Caudoviricetes sp.]
MSQSDLILLLSYLFYVLCPSQILRRLIIMLFLVLPIRPTINSLFCQYFNC